MVEDTGKNSIETLGIIGIILGGLSSIGIISIISRILYNKNFYSGHLFTILIMLLISDLISNFSFSIYFIFNHKFCEFQSSIMVFSDSSMLLWNLILVLQTYQYISFKEDMKRRDWFLCILVGFFFPLFLATSGTLFEIYGQSNIWCYITDPVIGFLFAFMQFLIYGFNLFIIYFAKKFYKENEHEEGDTDRLTKYYYIFRFPYIHMFAFFIGVMNRFIILFGWFSTFLDISVILIYNSIGILNFLVFHYSYGNLNEVEESSIFQTLN